MSDFMERLAPLVEHSFPVQPGETLDEYANRVLASGLSPSQRAMLAVRINEVGRQIGAERRANKREWIAAARVAFDPGRREPCRVCGKYRSLSQAHHVVPLAIQYDMGVAEPDQQAVWLCPTHHAAIHILIGQVVSDRGRASRAVIEVAAELGVDEIRALLEILDAFKDRYGGGG